MTTNCIQNEYTAFESAMAWHVCVRASGLSRLLAAPAPAILARARIGRAGSGVTTTFISAPGGANKPAPANLMLKCCTRAVMQYVCNYAIAQLRNCADRLRACSCRIRLERKCLSAHRAGQYNGAGGVGGASGLSAGQPDAATRNSGGPRWRQVGLRPYLTHCEI